MNYGLRIKLSVPFLNTRQNNKLNISINLGVSENWIG